MPLGRLVGEEGRGLDKPLLDVGILGPVVLVVDGPGGQAGILSELDEGDRGVPRRSPAAGVSETRPSRSSDESLQT